MLRNSVPASFSLVFSRHLKSLIIISLGSFCFIFGASVIQAWGQSILGSAYKFSGQTVAGPVHAGGVGGPWSGVCRRRGWPTRSGAGS